jgi:hypothetical protein
VGKNTIPRGEKETSQSRDILPQNLLVKTPILKKKKTKKQKNKKNKRIEGASNER